MKRRQSTIRIRRARDTAASIDRLLLHHAIPPHVAKAIRRHVEDIVAVVVETEDHLTDARVTVRQHAALLHQLSTPVPATPDPEAVPL